jgi:glycosyltransferase involved in cell wall biosynthesis
MNPDSQIILVSPAAHYPSHDWPNTAALLRALRQKGQPARAIIFSPGAEPVPPDLRGDVEPVFRRTPWPWRNLAADKWQERRFASLTTVCETFACLFKALRLARRYPRPVLHFLGGSYWMVVLAVLCFRRVRCVYSLYEGMLSGPAKGVKARLRPHLKRLLQRVAATGRMEFICENEFVRKEMAALVGSRIHLIPYAIADNEKLPLPEEARRRLDLPLKEKILLFFGTHRREKDYHTALKGCLVLPEPPLALFVGKVISANDPRKVAADCHYANVRIVDDFVPEEMAKYYFAAADAVVLPYEASFSRGSGVLIECCRHLRPMIVSAAPYFSSFLSRYPCGVTYQPGDSESFARAAALLLAGGAGYRAALEQAKHDHSWTAIADLYLKLYASKDLSET